MEMTTNIHPSLILYSCTVRAEVSNASCNEGEGEVHENKCEKLELPHELVHQELTWDSNSLRCLFFSQFHEGRHVHGTLLSDSL